MGRPKRDIRAAAEESTTPPSELTSTQSLAQVVKAEGNNLYTCSLPQGRSVLVELAARFRKTIWIKRGGYVLVDLASTPDQKTRVEGEIVNVVREEREWRKQAYWPSEFAKRTHEEDEEDEEEDVVGRMPPSDSEDEE